MSIITTNITVGRFNWRVSYEGVAGGSMICTAWLPDPSDRETGAPSFTAPNLELLLKELNAFNLGVRYVTQNSG